MRGLSSMSTVLMAGLIPIVVRLRGALLAMPWAALR